MKVEPQQAIDLSTDIEELEARIVPNACANIGMALKTLDLHGIPQPEGLIAAHTNACS